MRRSSWKHCWIRLSRLRRRLVDQQWQMLPSVWGERVIRTLKQLDLQLLQVNSSEVKIARRFHCQRIALWRSGLTRCASFRKSMVSRSGTERLILNCLGWLLTVTLSWTSIWDSFSRSSMGPMMELTSLKPWTWLGFFSIWSLILRESQLVLGREWLSHDLNVTPVIDTWALRFWMSPRGPDLLERSMYWNKGIWLRLQFLLDTWCRFGFLQSSWKKMGSMRLRPTAFDIGDFLSVRHWRLFEWDVSLWVWKQHAERGCEYMVLDRRASLRCILGLDRCAPLFGTKIHWMMLLWYYIWHRYSLRFCTFDELRIF